MIDTEKLREEFRFLADRWNEDTKYLSSTTKMAEHPACVRIVEMGAIGACLVFEELAKEASWLWLIALAAHFKATPVPESDTGKIHAMREHWLKYGRSNGYLT